MSAPVLLVEDHGLVATSLVTALAATGVVLIHVDPDASTDLVGIAEQHGCQLVLLDLDLGHGVRGLDMVAALRTAGLRVVILSATEDEVEVARAFEAGAEGYVSKRASFAFLVGALSRAAAGEAIQPPLERDRLMQQLRAHRHRTRARGEMLDALTRREREVLAGLCAGRNAQQLADEAVVALSTIRTHIQAVLRKLDVGSQVAAIAVARESGWDLRSAGSERGATSRRRDSH